MEFYSFDPEADKLTAVQHKIEEVKQRMVTNVEKAIERGEKIEELVDKYESDKKIIPTITLIFKKYLF